MNFHSDYYTIRAMNFTAQASGAANGVSIDVAGAVGAGAAPGGWKSATFICVADNGASGTTTFKLQESSDNSNWSDISGASAVHSEASAQTIVLLVLKDLHARLRYLRVVSTVATTNSDMTGALVALGGSALAVPTSMTAVVV